MEEEPVELWPIQIQIARANLEQLDRRAMTASFALDDAMRNWTVIEELHTETGECDLTKVALDVAEARLDAAEDQWLDARTQVQEAVSSLVRLESNGLIIGHRDLSPLKRRR